MKRLAIITAILCGTACGHGGGLDRHGGHVDHRTGRYHYHRGGSSYRPPTWINAIATPMLLPGQRPTFRVWQPLAVRKNMSVRAINKHLKDALKEYKKLHAAGEDTEAIKKYIHEVRAQRIKAGGRK